MVTLRQIEAFRGVMMTGTVTRAADMLYVSQPAVSRMLADLEQEIGFKLFTRANRQLTPTPEGVAFYDEVERAFVGLSQIGRAATAIREYRRGHLRLITIPSLASTFTADLVARFTQTYPDISVSIEVQPTQRVFEWIISQQCDIGISTAPIENSAITSRSVLAGQAACILPTAHPLAKKRRIRPKDLDGLPFISFKADSLFRRQVDDVFRLANVARHLKIEARTTDALCGLVAAGLGVSIVGSVLSGDLRYPGIVTRPFDASIPVEVAILSPAHRPLARIAENFIQIVDDYVGELAQAKK